MKYYLGIDIGKKQHTACLMTEEGEQLAKPLTFAFSNKGWAQFLSYVDQRSQGSRYEDVHAALEATGHYWLTVYVKLKALGMRVSVLNPLEVKAFRNEGIRGSKTDRIDAIKIAKLVRFGEFHEAHVPSEDLFALRQLTRLKSDLVDMTTQVKQKVIALLDQIFPEYQQLFSDTFGTTSKALLSEAVTPEAIAVIPTEKLTTLVRNASRGQYGEEKARRIKQAAEGSIGLAFGMDAFSLSLEILLTQLSHLQKQVDQLEQEIGKRVKQRDTVLVTIPGIGSSLAGSILAEIGDVERFGGKDGAEKLVAFAGLDAKVRDSGISKGKAKMSKRGSGYLRHAVRQAAFVAVTVSKDPLFTKVYQRQINREKHMEVALSHVGRKMLHVIYSVLRNQKTYVPNI